MEVEEKIAAWLKAGVRCVVSVNPGSRSVTVYRTPARIVLLRDVDDLDLSDVVAGFRCRVAEIFE